jgi:hypothetical protein
MADFETEDISLADFLKLPPDERELYRKWVHKKLKKIARAQREAENGVKDEKEGN